MELNITSSAGVADTISVSDVTFGKAFNEDLVHQIVVAYRAAARQGTKAQKNRSAVNGGGRKPWRQKGSGRARAGTIRSPLWRGGGVTFASQSRNYAQKVNKKMYRAGLRCIVSELARQGRLIVVESLELTAPKTQGLIQYLGQYNIVEALIVTEEVTKNLYLASRNLHRVDVVDVQGINPINLINFDKVVFTVSALKKIEEKLT